MPFSRSGARRATLTRWLPGLVQLQEYPRGALRSDIVAGTSVCVVMIPSVLAYAELVGVRPEAGLYAAIGAMLAYALLTSSRSVIVGPDTTIALLAGSIIAPLAAGDPVRAAMLAAALAMATGVLLMLAGRLKLGNAADLLSTPVLIGYAAGAALVLIGTQLPALLGLALPRDPFFLRVVDAFAALRESHIPTVALGAGQIALMLAIARYTPRVPGTVIGCGVAIAASLAFDLPYHGVAHLRPLPTGLPMPALPSLEWRDLQALAPGAIALALLVFAEGVLLARTLAEKRGDTVNPDQELTALGMANVAASVVAGFPVGASTSRSVTAEAAGVRTQLAQWIAVALLVAFVLVLAQWLVVLPRVALAAILIVAATRLIDLAQLRTLFALDRRAFGLALAVALGVLILGVLPGVLLGVGLSLARVLLEVARPRDALLRRLPIDRRFHDLTDDEGGLATPGVLVYRLYAPLIFANARHVSDRLHALAAEAVPALRCLVLDLQAVTHIDVTAFEVLRQWHDAFERAGIDVRFARANRPLREQLNRWLPEVRAEAERFFPSASAAVDDFLATHPTPPP
ncbi:MAG: SulP family inorganic anion transporter [Betaproteobacteria bacterium]